MYAKLFKGEVRTDRLSKWVVLSNLITRGELKQRRRRRRGQRLVKNELILYKQNLRLQRSVRYSYIYNESVQFQMEISKISRRRPRFERQRRTWSFHVVVLQRTAKKCTKIYNARARLLFRTLKLLFRAVHVAVVVVVCLSSLFLSWPGLFKGWITLSTE